MIEIGDKVFFLKYKKSGLWRKGIVSNLTKHNGKTLYNYTVVAKDTGKDVKITTFSHTPLKDKNIKKITNSMDFIID